MAILDILVYHLQHRISHMPCQNKGCTECIILLETLVYFSECLNILKHEGGFSLSPLCLKLFFLLKSNLNRNILTRPHSEVISNRRKTLNYILGLIIYSYFITFIHDDLSNVLDTSLLQEGSTAFLSPCLLSTGEVC